MSKTPEPLDLDAFDDSCQGLRNEPLIGAFVRRAEILAAEVRSLRSLLSTMEARAPLPPPLVWSKEKPKVEGDYWRWKAGWVEPMLESVIGYKYGLYIYGEERDECIRDIDPDTYWMKAVKPTPPPTEGPTV